VTWRSNWLIAGDALTSQNDDPDNEQAFRGHIETSGVESNKVCGYRLGQEQLRARWGGGKTRTTPEALKAFSATGTH